MSWVARKIAGLDNEHIQKIQEEYFKAKEKSLFILEDEQEEEKKFWQEYEDEYYNG